MKKISASSVIVMSEEGPDVYLFAGEGWKNTQLAAEAHFSHLIEKDIRQTFKRYRRVLKADVLKEEIEESVSSGEYLCENNQMIYLNIPMITVTRPDKKKAKVKK